MSRAPAGLPSSARDAAASNRLRASSTRSTGGRVRCAFGDPSNAPGSVSLRPVRWAQAVKTLTAVALRDMVVRAYLGDLAGMLDDAAKLGHLEVGTLAVRALR